MKSSFYTTLVSSEKCDFYHNTFCDFKTYLPTPICGEYEVAICSITYNFSATIIPHSTIIGILPTDGTILRSRSDITSIADLSKQIEEFKAQKINLRSINWIQELKSVFTTTRDNRIIIPIDKFYGTHHTEMNIFCSEIELERFASQMKPLLRSTAYYHPKPGACVSHEFPSLQYKRLCSNYLESIHIYIRNHLDLPVPIREGRVSLVLHFRNVSPNF